MAIQLNIAKVAILTIAFYLWNSTDLSGAPSKNLADRTWQKLLTDNLVLTYYSLGQIGDLYRAKVYAKEKTLRYIEFLKKIIKQKKSLLNTAKPKRGRRGRQWLESVKSMLDLIDLACQNLKGTIEKSAGKSIKQFITYRNAAAQDLRKILIQSKKKLYGQYRNRKKWSLKAIGLQLRETLPLTFLAIGVTADGYFQLVFSPNYTLNNLRAYKTLLKEQKKSLKKLKNRFRGMDKIYISRIIPLYSTAINLIESLEKFIKSRQRVFLVSYIKNRIFLYKSLRIHQ